MNYKYTLSDNELLLLDGKCSEALQKDVDRAKSRSEVIGLIDGDSDDPHSQLVAQVVLEAKEKGRIIFQHKQISHCSLCKTFAGYYAYPRRSRYHSKGDLNYDRPRYMSGYEFADRFVTMKGHATLGCCSDCFAKIKDTLLVALKDIKAQVPERLTGYPAQWERVAKRRCLKCGWEGPESQMGRKRTLMGDGTYPATCPKCPAASGLFSSDVEVMDGFYLENREATDNV